MLLILLEMTQPSIQSNACIRIVILIDTLEKQLLSDDMILIILS